MTHSFWKNKRVFITGHTGFKGSWLTLWLHKMGAQVIGFSKNLPSEPNMFHLAMLDDCAVSTVGDICSREQICDAVASAEPDIVFHLAAQSLVRASYTFPVETYTTNIMGTVHVLEACRQVPRIHAVIVVTSDKCYENRERQEGYREDEAMGGYDPYSSSKGAAELITAAYRRSFFQKNSGGYIAVASARAGNVIGGGDFAGDRLIPDFIRAIEQDTQIAIRNPHAVRPWQFVLEPLGGYLSLAEKLYEHGQTYAESWNFGPHDTDAKPVGDVSQTFCRILMETGLNPPEICVAKGENATHEAGLLKLNISKACQRLNWVPKLDLEAALQLTAEWYGVYLKNGNVRAVTERQIEQFQRS